MATLGGWKVSESSTQKGVNVYTKGSQVIWAKKGYVPPKVSADEKAPNITKTVTLVNVKTGKTRTTRVGGLDNGVPVSNVIEAQLKAEREAPSKVGGYYVTPSGGQICSNQTEAQLNKNLANASVGGVDYFSKFGKSGFEPVISKGKDFVGRYVQVGVAGESQKVVGQRARDVISQSQTAYTKSQLQSLAGQKKVIVKEPVVKDENFKAPTWQNVVRKGDYVGGGLTLLGESVNLISYGGEKVKTFATKQLGYVPETGLNVFNPLTAPQRGVYLAGSFGKGLGEGYKFFGSVPGLVGAGVGAAPRVFGEFVSKPVESGFKYGGLSAGFIGGSLTSFGESFVTDPVSFAGEYAGGYAAFGVGGKGVGLVGKQVGKAVSIITPRVKFGEIASKRVEGYYKKGDLKALQFSDVGVKNVDELIAYPKSSQAAKYFAKTTGTKLGKGEGVVVRVMTARTEGYIGRLLGKKQLVVGSKGAYTDYEIGSLFSAGVEPTGFPIKGLASGKTAYEFSILPKAPKFYDPNILLIKTGIGKVSGKDSVKLLKQFGYDLRKSPNILEQNISKVGAGKRVLQVRQIKGFTQKELNKELQKILVKPSLKTSKAYPTTSELIGTQTEAEFTFIRGTNLEKVGLKTLGQRVTGRTATTEFPIGGGKSLLTDVELYANVSKASKNLTAYEKSVLKDISQAAKGGYSVKRYVSPFDVTSVGSASLVSRGSYVKPKTESYYSRKDVSRSLIDYSYTPSKVSQYSPVDVSQYYVPSSSSSYSVSSGSRSVKRQDYGFVQPVSRVDYGSQVSVSKRTSYSFPSYGSKDYRKYFDYSYVKPKPYGKKRQSQDNVFKLPKFKREGKVKGLSYEYSGKGLKNIILPIRTDWLKALKYYEKKPSVSTIELLPSKAKGSRQIAGLLGFKF
jgi:hypothetical protein